MKNFASRGVTARWTNGLKFETRGERDVQRAIGKLLAAFAWMVEKDLARQSVNERASVQILNASDTRRFGQFDGFSLYHIMRRRVRLQPALRH